MKNEPRYELQALNPPKNGFDLWEGNRYMGRIERVEDALLIVGMLNGGQR